MIRLIKDKLNGLNFIEWYRNPITVLKQEGKKFKEKGKPSWIANLSQFDFLLSLTTLLGKTEKEEDF